MITSLLLAFLLSGPAQAEPTPGVRGRIYYVQCGSLQSSSGATSVSYSGQLGQNHYFNLSNLAFGIPYSEQALVQSVQKITGGLQFRLTTVFTRQTFYLELYDKTQEGYISYEPGSPQGMKLTCQAKIEIED